jgi:hypothetical protein
MFYTAPLNIQSIIRQEKQLSVNNTDNSDRIAQRRNSQCSSPTMRSNKSKNYIGC